MHMRETVDPETSVFGLAGARSEDDGSVNLPPGKPTAEAAAAGQAATSRPALQDTVFWMPTRAATAPRLPLPPLLTALRRGVLCRCPACGKADLFHGYLRVVDRCGACDAPLGSARADDAPPYFTIFIVGHVVVLLMVMAERRWDYSMWTAAAIWIPVTLALSLLLLRPIKGATVGLMLKLDLMKSNSGE